MPINTREFLQTIAQYHRRVEANGSDPMPIDWSAFDSFSRTFDKEEIPSILMGLIQTFLEEAEHLLRTLETAAGAQDTQIVHRTAHSLKSSSGNMGARQLARLCQVLEEGIRVNSVENVAKSVDKIKMEYERVRRSLTEKLDEIENETIGNPE